MIRRRLRLPKTLLWLLIPLPALFIGLRHAQPVMGGLRVIDVVAAIPEAGGFQPDSIQVQAGEKVLLRFHAQDVAHGVAIGPGLGVDLGDVEPGQTKSVVLTFDEAGTFTFYCNLWCSPNHWRMRGVIDVMERDGVLVSTAATVEHDPVIDALIAEGVDIDANVHDNGHSGGNAVPAMQDVPRPSAARGAALAQSLVVPSQLQDQNWRRTHTPRQGKAALAAANPRTGDQELADLAAFLWVADGAPDRLDQAKNLYAKNCTACHGESGGGDGTAAGFAPQLPASLSDPERMLDRRPDVLYAKIRRGGMGTGMPNFGTLFTPEETWSLVDFVWRLAVGDPGGDSALPPAP